MNHPAPHPLLDPETLATIERAASEHLLGRPWLSQGFTSLDERSSHPCGVFRGLPFSVFAKLSTARKQFTAELGTVAPIQLPGRHHRRRETSRSAASTSPAWLTPSGATSRRLYAETGGNPLALVELSAALTAEQLAGAGPSGAATLGFGSAQQWRSSTGSMPARGPSGPGPSCAPAARPWPAAATAASGSPPGAADRPAGHRGRTNAEVSRTLFFSTRTVEFHLSRTYRKLGVASRTELTAGSPARARARADHGLNIADFTEERPGLRGRSWW